MMVTMMAAVLWMMTDHAELVPMIPIDTPQYTFNSETLFIAKKHIPVSRQSHENSRDLTDVVCTDESHIIISHKTTKILP